MRPRPDVREARGVQPRTARVPRRTGGTALLIGLDAVAHARAEHLWNRYGGRGLERLTSPAEREHPVRTSAASGTADDPATRWGRLLAAKEATIKAIGGRPPGFRWQQVRTGVQLPDGVPGAPAGVLAALRPFAPRPTPDRGEGPAIEGVAIEGVGLDGPLERAAAVRLGCDPGELRAAVRFGLHHDHHLALVVIWW